MRAPNEEFIVADLDPRPGRLALLHEHQRDHGTIMDNFFTIQTVHQHDHHLAARKRNTPQKIEAVILVTLESSKPKDADPRSVLMRHKALRCDKSASLLHPRSAVRQRQKGQYPYLF
jgi:hypothetical protein